MDGAPIAEANGQVVWRPDFPGFYRITAIDARGRQAVARVKVR